MAKELLVDVETLSHELRGIARKDGKTIFVRGAMVGEQVTIASMRNKRTWSEGIVKQLHKSHPERITPFCSKADYLTDEHPCGGCALQYMPAKMQLQEKQSVVENLLQKYVTPNLWHAPIESKEIAYRRKARLGVRYNKKSDKVYVGFREASSHYIADITSCPILDKSIGPYLENIAVVIAQLTVADAIPQIEVAVTDDACALVFRHLQPLTDTDTELLTDLCKQYKWQLWLQPSNYASVHLVYSPTPEETLLSYVLPEFDVKMYFHPLDFTQVNSGVNSLLVSQAINWLDLTGDETLFDLFSGIGNFSLALATKVKKLVAIEGEASLVERCQNNAETNNLDIIAQCMDLYSDKNLTELEQLCKKLTPCSIVLDPPRTGCEEVIKMLVKQPSIKKILYVSCSPNTLARDCASLIEGGFVVKKAGVADMFPQTTHIETICLFHKTK